MTTHLHKTRNPAPVTAKQQLAEIEAILDADNCHTQNMPIEDRIRHLIWQRVTAQSKMVEQMFLKHKALNELKALKGGEKT